MRRKMIRIKGNKQKENSRRWSKKRVFLWLEKWAPSWEKDLSNGNTINVVYLFGFLNFFPQSYKFLSLLGVVVLKVYISPLTKNLYIPALFFIRDIFKTILFIYLGILGLSPRISLEGMMLKLKLQYFGHLMRRVDSLEKTLMLGGIGGMRRRGHQRMRWLDGITNSMHEFGWTLGADDGQGGLECCDSWGHKQLDTTEWLNWTELNPGTWYL